MSELTQCNYCSLKQIERGAKEKGLVVTKLRGWRGGTDIFVHPEGVEIRKANREDRDKYFVMWAWEISKSCVC